MNSEFDSICLCFEKLNHALRTMTLSTQELAQALNEGHLRISIEMWAKVKRPKLYYLTHHGKNVRIRKKNLNRIYDEFFKVKR